MPFGLGFFATAGVSAAAGSYELIASEILTGSQSSVTFSNLGNYSSTYKHLQIRYVARSSEAQNYGSMNIRFNGDSGSNYARHELSGNGSSVSSGAASSQTSINFHIQLTGANNTTGSFGAGVVDILDPYSTSKNTTIRTLGGRTGNDPRVNLHSGAWFNTAALTSIELITNSGSVISGSRFSLYGIKG